MIKDDLELIGNDIHENGPESDRSSLADDLRNLQKQESELRLDRDRAEIRLRDAERELSKAKARQEAQVIDSWVSSHYHAALTRLRESGQISGILGTLGELTSPKDPLTRS